MKYAAIFQTLIMSWSADRYIRWIIRWSNYFIYYHTHWHNFRNENFERSEVISLKATYGNIFNKGTTVITGYQILLQHVVIGEKKEKKEKTIATPKENAAISNTIAKM